MQRAAVTSSSSFAAKNERSSQALQSDSRVLVEGRNSCYFTCSIHYLNASSAPISRYREISGRRFLLSYGYHARP